MIYESNCIIVFTIATAIFSSLGDQWRVVYFIAIGIMKIWLINLQDINITLDSQYMDRRVGLGGDGQKRCGCRKFLPARAIKIFS